MVHGQKVMHDNAATVIALEVANPMVRAEAAASNARLIRPFSE